MHAGKSSGSERRLHTENSTFRSSRDSEAQINLCTAIIMQSVNGAKIKPASFCATTRVRSWIIQRVEAAFIHAPVECLR